MVFLVLLWHGLQVLDFISKIVIENFVKKGEVNMVKIFETKVTAVGMEADSMIDNANMLILFGEGAPDDLAEFCYTIDNKSLSGAIHEGSILSINQIDYKVTSIGSVVETNLQNLGHITIAFDGSTEGSLPGTLHVEGQELPRITEGSMIALYS